MSPELAGQDPASRPGRLGVGVIGAGRVGAVLGAALLAALAGLLRQSAAGVQGDLRQHGGGVQVLALV